MNIDTVIEYLHSGDYDEELDLLADQVRQRQQIVASLNASKLKRGDTVEMLNIRPKYLTGLTATVTSVRGDKVEATMDQTARKFREGSPVVLNANCVRKVDMR